ncbi:MAG: hypothetical protein ACTS47_00085 [Candidatus Hodgkinia cicadicola]
MCFPSKQLIHFEEVVSQTGKSFLIITDEIGGKALTTLVLNELRFNFKVSSVKLLIWKHKNRTLADIALIIEFK